MVVRGRIRIIDQDGGIEIGWKKKDKNLSHNEAYFNIKRRVASTQWKNVFILLYSLGHRKYRYLYRQNVRVQPWYSTLKQIGFSQPSSALVDPNQWSRIMQA